MVSCITGAARREIVLFYQMGVAEMMKRFSQQKYNESQGQKYLDRKQKKEEETRRSHADRRKLYQKQEYLNRKQESGEDTREC